MIDDAARRALGDTLSFLGELARDAVRPTEALVRLGALRKAHPELDVSLVWDENEFPGTVHYDVLLRSRGADTVSLSVCRTSDTPWPLRGVRLASDQDLVRVNGATLKVRDAMGYIDFMWNEARILRPIVDVCIIEEAVKQRSVQPTANSRQRALDAFRSAHGLLSAAQTHAWMEANELTQDRLETMLDTQAHSFALRDLIASDACREAYWSAHPGAFDVAHIARFRMRARDRAEQVVAAIHAGRDFYGVLEEEFTRGTIVATVRGALEHVRRHELAPMQADAVFSTQAGKIVGPVETDGCFDIVRVIRTERASLDDTATREAVSAAVFEQWLADQRKAATVEWFWGPKRPE